MLFNVISTGCATAHSNGYCDDDDDDDDRCCDGHRKGSCFTGLSTQDARWTSPMSNGRCWFARVIYLQDTCSIYLLRLFLFSFFFPISSLMRIGSLPLPQQQFCLQLNVSLCSATETSSRFTVTVFNPLSHQLTSYVRFPVDGSNAAGNSVFTVLDPDGGLFLFLLSFYYLFSLRNVESFALSKGLKHSQLVWVRRKWIGRSVGTSSIRR